MVEEQLIHIPSIKLKWSYWVPWNDLKIDARGASGIRVPNKAPGVYEVKYSATQERLTIGKAADLRMRIKQGLVKGKSAHSTGDKIRPQEDVSILVVRSAVTDRPSAVEEELPKKYQAKFGKLPKYTDHT